ncbi:MAG: hypothetical protein EON92_13270 [Burkholderiales bacterium]|nr:MAG: hypothetical protein EON92_13270 [Burkholderiales bacterium]
MVTRKSNFETDPVTALQELKAADDARPGVPGEHWVVLAAGVGLWLLTRRSPSFLLRTLGLIGGTALAGRAASGRDGIAKLLRYTPLGSRIRRG